ncbi:hypothetical protein AAU01_23760 [Paenarthrobacter aurescens]|uniref:Uncharacterized protein n=1 Tax=Paenarthrobacter aurescens TaxID=43663 RepID=A0A4Y3NKW7_PAEAU|nr:hypothetical protein AAU01_23760 [Paenarthrobacter aurescens]
MGAAGEGGAAGTATDGVPEFVGGGTEGTGSGAAGTDVVGAVLAGGVRGAMETVGKEPGSEVPEGAGVQPATHKPKMRQAAVIVVTLCGPRPACMTAPRSCPSTCISNVRTGRPNTTCRYGDGSDKS